MELEVGLDDVELADVVDGLVELAEEVGVAGVACPTEARAKATIPATARGALLFIRVPSETRGKDTPSNARSICASERSALDFLWFVRPHPMSVLMRAIASRRSP